MQSLQVGFFMRIQHNRIGAGLRFEEITRLDRSFVQQLLRDQFIFQHREPVTFRKWMCVNGIISDMKSCGLHHTSMELHHFPVYDRENSFSLYRVHHGQAGEFAERRQDAMRGSKIITGKGEGLPALSGYTDTGMQVPGEKK